MVVESKRKIVNRLWLALFIIATIGVILMITDTFVYGSGEINGVKKREDWKEYIILWLYFTFMSNMFAIVVSALVRFRKVEPSNEHLQRVKIMMAVNLTVTALIFWAVIAKNLQKYTTSGIISTSTIHAITPVFALVVFFYDGSNTKMKEKRVKPVRTAMINIVFPVLWLIMAIGAYFAFGYAGPYKEGAIYEFIDFYGNFWTSIMIIGIIAVMYPALTLLYTWIVNK